MDPSVFTVSPFSWDWDVAFDGVTGGVANADGRNSEKERTRATTNNMVFLNMESLLYVVFYMNIGTMRILG